MPGLAAGNSEPVWFGTDRSDRARWDGRIDELAFFNRALSADEVQGLYAAVLDTIRTKRQQKLTKQPLHRGAHRMNYFPLASLLALVCVSSTHAAGKEKHLFILSGQSNMARLGPSISFTPTVETAFGKGKVVVVKDAQSGQPISRWYKKWKPAQGDAPATTGDLYGVLTL